MKKNIFTNLLVVLVSLFCFGSIMGQNLVPFSPRYDQAIKGDILLIGNSNLGVHRTNPYSGNNNNESSANRDNMVYVDIDTDSNTFNSSSADLDVPNDVSCYQIVYAGLYWSSVVKGNTAMETIKFKTPGSGSYLDITGSEVYYQNSSDNRNSNTFVYYSDVTNILAGLSNPEGTYTVANISAMTSVMMTSGLNNEGLSAGWSLFVIYEDPLLPSKYITSFDGFTKIDNQAPNNQQTFTIDGFQTIPVGPVRAKYAFSALEGDRSWTQDYLEINGTRINATNASGTVIRPNNNFFNSTVSIIDPTTNSPILFTDRNPTSTNTLGFDAGIINIPNARNSLIGNGDTSATIRLGTNTDIYYFYFSAFAIDIIAPNIVLTKIVEDEFGNDIGGQLVNLGDKLYYTIGFKNTGNDDATNLTIRDILPENIIFNYPTDLGVLPPGVTVQSYNPTTREIIFSVDSSVVEEYDPVTEIRYMVTVVSSCRLLNDACSNIISTQAFSTYQGNINTDFTISDDPSFATNIGCLLTLGATNVLADLNCDFTEDVVLCGSSVTLTAGNGYDAYSWSTSPSGTPIIGTTQSITVTSTGTYYVHNTSTAPCQSIDQIFNVITFGAGVTNPLIPFADEVVVCPNDGKQLPNFYLCGANDSRFIQTGITDTTSIIWEKLDESSCTAVANQDCANEDSACIWNQVATGPDFNIVTAGQYRLTLNYTGGCFNQFYFNVYTNLLVPTVSSRDIYCTTPGEIMVGGVPTGYEFSIDGVNYQASNVFTVTTAGLYNVYIRQLVVSPNPCIFSVPDVQIRKRDFTVSTIINQPLCYGELGSVVLAANDVRPQYFFSIYQGATLVNSVGPITQSDYTFDNLNPGTYTVNVSTEDGCMYTGYIEIIQPPELTATAAITKPLTCTDGEITVYPVGGTPPYQYFVNSTTVFQGTPIINVPSASIYNITVVDFNNCSVDVSIEIDATPAPDFTVSQTNILCADDVNSGSITFNVTNPNGNILEYSIDNGVTFTSSPVFTGLSSGTYETIVQYTIGTDVCLTTPQTITITAALPITGTANVTAPYTCTTNGEITISGVTGGTAPYEYSIDGVNFRVGNTFSGLTDGDYTITIRDASNCLFVTVTATIDSLDPPTDLDFSSTTLSCPTVTTDVTLTATGGTAPLEYRLISPSTTAYQASNIFAGLSPGTYTFEVRDSNDCTYTESYTIAPLPPVMVNMVITKDLDCTASPGGIITGTISSGLEPFTYQVSFNGGAYGSTSAVIGSSFTHTVTTDGTYQFQITDANGCTVESGVQTINPLITVTASDAFTNPTCNGYNDGSIQLTALTGLAPFTYSIDGGLTFVSTNTFGGLVAGNYNYVVRDSKSCDATGIVNLIDPLPIDVTIVRNPIQCNSNVPGSLDITINSGGVAPFTYTLYGSTYTQIGLPVTTASTTNTFSGLSFGDYYVSVVDSNGCEYLSDRQRIEAPPIIQLDGNASTGSCATGATVDISVISGFGPFTYSIFGQPATAFGPVASTSHTFTGLNHGVTYQFQVIDSGGCFSIIEVTTPILSAIEIDAVTTTDVNCNGDTDGSVSFTVLNYDASVTSLYYEVQDELTNTPIAPAQNGTFTGLTGAPVSTTITGLPAGNYTLFVREADGTLCTTSELFQITQPIQPLASAITSNINANCNVGAQVTVITTGGTGPYQYAAGALGFIPTFADFGTSNVLNLDYAIRTNWDIVVRDSNGCEVRLNETINIDPEPVIDAVVNNQCTVTEGNFEIDVTLTTLGVGPYSFSVDGGAFQTRTAPFTISNLASGTHTVEVQDANGCGNLVSVDIQEPINLIPNVTAIATCNDDDGEITITGAGGTGSYAYTISPNPASISLSGNVFSGVPSGTYTVTITDAITSCFEDAIIFVPLATLPNATLTSPTVVACFGDNDGTFELNVSNYTGPYTYEVFDSSSTSVFGVVAANTSTNPQIVTGLLADIYTVVVTETASPFCSTTSGTVIIQSPASTLVVVATETSNVTCDDNAGTITAVASGGWGTYEYELTGAATVAYSPNGTFTGLSAGVYMVNVRDAQGCVASDTVTLTIPNPINATVTASTTLLSCYGDTNASITTSLVSGGQGSNYTYTLNMTSPTVSSSGPQSSPVFNNLGAGTYNVVVSDGYNCSFNSLDIIINEPTEVQASLVKETSQTCLTDATLTLSASGGTGTFEYSDTVSFSTILGSFATSTTFSVSAGTYQYYVRDNNGCVASVSNEITIDPLPILDIILDVSNATINCVGDTTGVIVATAQGGLGNYIYTLEDTAGNPISPVTQDSPGVFTNLPVGIYQVRVDSGDCLITSAQISITEPAAPLTTSFVVSNVTCPGVSNGMLEITASGGTGTIKYAISPRLDQFFETATFENLAAGNYQVIAQDELGCYVLFDFIVEDPIPVALTIVPGSVVPEGCDGENNGAFSIEIFGGEMPYSVAIDNINGPYVIGSTTQTFFDFDDLGGGDHIVYVRDNLGCETEWNIPFPEFIRIAPIALVENGCANNMSTNTVTITVDGSVNLVDLDYSLDGAPFQASNIFIDVPAGIGHYVDVRHTSGCVQRTELFDIPAYQQLQMALDDSELNIIKAVTTGGAEPYEYTLNGVSYGDQDTFIINESGNYTVTVTDAYGCIETASGYFEYVDVCIPNYFTPNGDGNLDEWGPGCTSQYRNMTFDIFDRYGRKIATLNVDQKWDGMYNGKELPTGDYWYVVRLNDSQDGREFVGHFTLYR